MLYRRYLAVAHRGTRGRAEVFIIYLIAIVGAASWRLRDSSTLDCRIRCLITLAAKRGTSWYLAWPEGDCRIQVPADFALVSSRRCFVPEEAYIAIDNWVTMGSGMYLFTILHVVVGGTFLNLLISLG